MSEEGQPMAAEKLDARSQWQHILLSAATVHIVGLWYSICAGTTNFFSPSGIQTVDVCWWQQWRQRQRKVQGCRQIYFGDDCTTENFTHIVDRWPWHYIHKTVVREGWTKCLMEKNFIAKNTIKCSPAAASQKANPTLWPCSTCENLTSLLEQAEFWSFYDALFFPSYWFICSSSLFLFHRASIEFNLIH